jgi:hypothetical protein
MLTRSVVNELLEMNCWKGRDCRLDQLIRSIVGMLQLHALRITRLVTLDR